MILKQKIMQLMVESKGKSLLFDIASGAMKPNIRMNVTCMDMSSDVISL